MQPAAGTFGAPTLYAVGGSGEAIAIADVNGDGVPDIVAGGTTGILLDNGNGTFHAGPPLPPVASGTLIWAFAAGDLNGGNKVDIVYADTENSDRPSSSDTRSTLIGLGEDFNTAFVQSF